MPEMRGTGFPVIKDIVLLGGGHAHVSVLRNFGMFPIDGARITLISPEAHTPYSGMLPGLIAGHYTFDEAHIDLMPLTRFAGARFLVTAVERIDPEARLVYCADGRPPLPYDVLSINTGSTPVFDPALTLQRDVIPVKPVSGFLQSWQGLKERVLAQPGRRIGVVGAGAGGIELLLSMQHALQNLGDKGAQRADAVFHAFTRDDAILKTHGQMVRDALGDALAKRGVTVHTKFDVSEVSEAGVSDGTRTVELDEIIWVTGAAPPKWFETSGLAIDARGFVAVDAFLRSTSHPDIFGAGDAVGMVDDPRPKSGVFAVRQGPALARNLRASVLGRPLSKYRPQKAFLSLISTGDQYAIASYAGWSIKGAWVWRWKDHIDRAFMRTFGDLPKMGERPSTVPRVADIPNEVRDALLPGAMRCGGCGAKVGASTLQRALGKLGLGQLGSSELSSTGDRCGQVSGQHQVDGDHPILLGVGDDAAAFEVPAGKVLVQTVDAFPAMMDDPYVFGQIAANHCLGDIFAMGARPHSALASVALPFALGAKREADLMQLLAGAKLVLDKAGCQIIGGHTGEAAELTLGFTVNGLADRQQVLHKSGLVPGVQLILTKPIGSGALFAAGGRGKAKGRWIEGAVANALRSNAGAADILVRHGAVAMTDVTGFGLLGHLGEMVGASGVGARVDVSKVPLLKGARTVVSQGVVSSLQRDNLGISGSVDATSGLAQSATYQLLFDPQTAGGLLAGVPQGNAAAAVAALEAAGYPEAAVIGEAIELDEMGFRIRLVEEDC